MDNLELLWLATQPLIMVGFVIGIVIAIAISIGRLGYQYAPWIALFAFIVWYFNIGEI